MADYPNWITYSPLKRNWDLLRGGGVTRLCTVKTIVIHYTRAPGQVARDIEAWFNGQASQGTLEDRKKYDLSSADQGSFGYGTHFVIDDSTTLALAPDPSYVFWQVGDSKSLKANSGALRHNKSRYPRGINYYTIGIEHCHQDSSGKFSSNVLKRSHQLVNWLVSKYGNGVDIARHYDCSGKACPVWFAPVLIGKNDDNRQVFPELSIEDQEIYLKNNRWLSLLQYYRQSNSDNIPSGLL